jgi:hypothetical protein
MKSSNDAIKILARRFVSLSPNVRLKVGERLLRWREENRISEGIGKHRVSLPCCAPKKSFLEQFWDEVEAAHGDGSYPVNPFSGGLVRPVFYPLAA